MKKLPLLVTAVAVVVALAGCVPSAATPSGSPTSSPSLSPTASATPTPSPTPTVSRADFGFTYFGAADIGSTFAEMSTQLGRPVSGLAECPWFGPVDANDPTLTFAFLDSQDSTAGVSFFYTQASAGVTSYPRNAENVGVGSTQAELLAAYPAAVVGSMHDIGAGTIDTVTVNDAGSGTSYVFGFTAGSGTVDVLQWGTKPGHQWSHLCQG